MCLSIAVRALAEMSPGLVWAPVEASLAWLLHVRLTLLICVDIWLVWVALLLLEVLELWRHMLRL